MGNAKSGDGSGAASAGAPVKSKSSKGLKPAKSYKKANKLRMLPKSLAFLYSHLKLTNRLKKAWDKTGPRLKGFLRQISISIPLRSTFKNLKLWWTLKCESRTLKPSSISTIATTTEVSLGRNILLSSPWSWVVPRNKKSSVSQVSFLFIHYSSHF